MHRHRSAVAVTMGILAVLLIAAGAWSAGVPRTAIPLGDGHRSTTTPAIGSILTCQANFNGGGASSPGPWLDEQAGTWNLEEKIAVLGNVNFDGSHTITTKKKKDIRVLKGNGLPLLPAGTFPIANTDPAYQYDHNPNSIQSVSVSYSVPLNPKRATTPTCLNMGPIGVLSDGVVLFNALDAQGRDAGAWEVLDAAWGHPERTGQYHHHTVPENLAPTTGSAHSGLVGYALDGFGIYGPLGTGGEVLANADLDACHGHTHRITWDGRSKSLYHYHATMEYPYTLGCYAGTPAN